MIIKHVVLKNWRNFRHVDVDLRDRLFIVGPNASGKSNFLDAFRFLRDIAKPGGGLQKAVQDRGGLTKLRCLAARQNPDVEIEIDLVNGSQADVRWKYSIGIKQEIRGYRQSILAYERVTKNGNEILSRPIDDDNQDPLLLTQTHLEQITANKHFREIAKFLESIQYMHLVPQLVRHSDSYTGPGVAGDPFGRNFLETVVREQVNVRKSRLKRIQEALVLAVPQLEELTDVQDEVGTPHLEAVYRHWRPKGAKQREDQFSDGTLRLIGLLWALMDGDSLLLLEEPELSLNAGIVRHLAALIYRIQRQRKRQVLVSTHSFDLLTDKGISGEEVLVLRPGSEGTQVELASDIQVVRDLLDSGLSVADAALPSTIPDGVDQLNLFS